MTLSLASTRNGWTDEILKRVKTKWIGGLTLNQITADINIEFHANFTRNAVIGQIRRKGWDKKWPREAPKNITESRERAAKEAARPQEIRNAKAKPQRQNGLTIRFTPVQAKYPDCIPDYVEVPPGNGYHFTRCQWPQVDPKRDAIQCEEKPVEGRPYCAPHCRRSMTSFGTQAPAKPAFVKWVTRGDGLTRQPE